MRLSINTGCTSQFYGIAENLRQIRSAGFDCFDFSFYLSEIEQRLCRDDYTQLAEEVLDAAQQNGIVCNQAHASFSFSFGREMNLSEPSYLALVRSIELAARLGAENIVVHSVLTPAGVDLTEYNLVYFRSLIPYCEKYGIHIAFENIFDYDPTHRCLGRFATPELMNRFLDALNHPGFTACVDVGHAAIGGTEPETLIRGISADRLTALHIQDTDYLDDRHLPPFLGLQHWGAICDALREIGYRGDLTLEIPKFFTHMDPALVPAGLAFASASGRCLIEKITRK